MCNCLRKLEKKTFEVAKKRNEGEFSDGKLLNCHFPIIDNQIKDRITYSEFQFLFAPRKKDGSIGKVKKQTISISHTYCPFCGEKHSNE